MSKGDGRTGDDAGRGESEPPTAVVTSPLRPEDPEEQGRTPADPATADDAVPLPVLTAPRDGVPPVVVDERRLVEAARALGSGTGPLAVDAERASGYRYGQRAYLVQFRRAGAGTWLLDPVACPDLTPLAEALTGVEWVLHAATQDLPCLAELGLTPSTLFDTELGSRLLGLPRVGLAAVIEHYLGIGLAKEHSAVDWSRRPLPEPWLRYAALDVEVLIELRDAIHADLVAAGKWTWAEQEFAALTRFTGPPTRPDPWRRTSGMHRVRSRLAAAVLREIWYARDDLAKERDLPPGRVLPDAVLLQLAIAQPENAAQLTATSTNRAVRRYQGRWLAAISQAKALPADRLPPLSAVSDAPPPPRAWADRDPAAAARLAQVREALLAFSTEHEVPVENLLSPDTVRRVLWSPPEPSPDAVIQDLRARGARDWQVQITAPILWAALRAHPSHD